MEALLSKLETQTNLTQKALDQLNNVLDEVNELYPSEDIWLGDIKLKKYVKTNSGFTFDGYYFDDEDSEYKDGFIPTCASELNTGQYYAGDFNAWVQYTDKHTVKYILTQLKTWVEKLIKKEDNYNNDLEKVLNIFKD